MAWEANDQPFALVNVAVGLKAGEIAKVVGRHETQLIQLREEFDTMTRMLRTLTVLLPGRQGVRAAAVK